MELNVYVRANFCACDGRECLLLGCHFVNASILTTLKSWHNKFTAKLFFQITILYVPLPIRPAQKKHCLLQRSIRPNISDIGQKELWWIWPNATVARFPLTRLHWCNRLTLFLLKLALRKGFQTSSIVVPPHAVCMTLKASKQITWRWKRWNRKNCRPSRNKMINSGRSIYNTMQLQHIFWFSQQCRLRIISSNKKRSKTFFDVCLIGDQQAPAPSPVAGYQSSSDMSMLSGQPCDRHGRGNLFFPKKGAFFRHNNESPLAHAFSPLHQKVFAVKHIHAIYHQLKRPDILQRAKEGPIGVFIRQETKPQRQRHQENMTENMPPSRLEIAAQRWYWQRWFRTTFGIVALSADSEILPTQQNHTKPTTKTRDKQPATSNEGQATSNEQRGTSNQQRATRDKQHATSNERDKQPATSNEGQATSNEQRGTSNMQQATRDKQRATRNEGPATSNKQRATRDKQSTTSNEGQAVNNKQRGTSSQQQATRDKQPTTRDKQQATSNQHTTSFATEADSLWYSYISPVRHSMFGFSAIVRQFLTPPPRLLILPRWNECWGRMMCSTTFRDELDLTSSCATWICALWQNRSPSCERFEVLCSFRSLMFWEPIFSSGPSWPRVSHCACRASRTLSAKVFAGGKRLYPGLSSSDFRRGRHAWQQSLLFNFPESRDLPWRSCTASKSGFGAQVRELQAKSGSWWFRKIWLRNLGV